MTQSEDDMDKPKADLQMSYGLMRKIDNGIRETKQAVDDARKSLVLMEDDPDEAHWTHALFVIEKAREELLELEYLLDVL